MAIKQDRPVDFGDDGIVVYVAKNKEEVDKARAALLAADVVVDIPEAAVEALFASGRESLPIRVPALSFKQAQKVIDELFPPPVIDLPPLPEAVPDSPEGQAGAAARAAAPEGGLARYEPPTPGSPGKANPAKVAESATKLVFIALASFLAVGPGLFLALFAAYSAWWCMERLQFGSAGREKAKIALGLAAASALWNVGAVLYLAWIAGWIGSR